MLRLLAPFLLLAVCAPSAAPLAEDRGAVGLRQTLRRLENPYRVLHIVAHPDDEDSGTVTYLSRGVGVDVTIASVTRGESGANLITGDFFDELGVLRTLEFRRAARHYGARLRFTSFADFGYSKNYQETLNHWKPEEVLPDLVRIIREERPHVILSRWRGDARDGHGQHSAAGLLAQRAYEAAADPTRFPELGAPAWRTLKLYADNRREDDDWTVAVDSGVYDPFLGRTYAEVARDGMRAHRSQGAGAAMQAPGPAVRYYKLIASEVGDAEREDSFFDRIAVDRNENLNVAVRWALKAFRADAPEATLPALAQSLRIVRTLDAGLERERLEALLTTAVRQALGLRFDVWVEPPDDGQPRSPFRPVETADVLTPGSSARVSATLHAPESVTVKSIRLLTPPGWQADRQGEGQFMLQLPANAEPTAITWRRDSIWDVQYRYDEDSWGRALPSAPVRGQAAIVVEGETLTLESPLEARYMDRERIQRLRQVAAGPAVSVAFDSTAGVLPSGPGAYEVNVRLEALGDRAIEGALRIEAPQGWRVAPSQHRFELSRPGEERLLSFTVTPSRDAAPDLYELRAVASYGGQESSAGFTRIHHPGLETAYVSRPAVHRVRLMDVAVAPGLEVGYVMGTGDAVPETIRQLGATVTLLDETTLATGDLGQFDVILLGMRAYAARDDVAAHNARLLAYVERGGVLIVQYNTPEYDNNYGPYPYSMTRRPEETAEEDAPVRILEPNHPVFTGPNTITEADFDGWVEQRGSKFLVEWDPRYTALVETHDGDQEPQRGVWLSARHGDGLYIYCALAWYRQLPEAVPGAVRIFANLLSLGAEDAPWRDR